MEGTEPEWVYKIPAAYGRVLPLGPRLARFQPASLHRRIALAVLRAPDGLEAAAVAWNRTPGRSPVARALGSVGAGSATAVRRARDGVLARALAYSRRRRFDSMVGQLDYLKDQGLGDVLLPYRFLPRLDAVLRVNGSSSRYRGPAIRQRKAAFFSGGALDFGSFEWQEIIDAQHRLWRCGVAFSELNQILGPMNWGTLEGRVRLADTSNLTTSARLARRLLDGALLDAKQRVVMERLAPPATPEVASEYFRFVRREINLRRFDELWRADVDGRRRPAPAGRGSEAAAGPAGREPEEAAGPAGRATVAGES